MIPKDLKLTKTHEWAKIDEGSNIVTVGISAYAVEQLGDIVYLELPAAGTAAKKEAPFSAVESVKTAVELYAPVDGEITESNSEITDSLDIFSQDPYGKAWMIKIKAADPGQLDQLMSAAEYESYIESQDSKD